jgi:cytochrome c oxidase assembly protein subunit 15
MTNPGVQSQRKFERLSLALVWGSVAVVLWGAFVRVTGSGAGCADHWPLCNGVLIPRAPKLQTLIELTHRVTSGALGILALVVLAGAFRAYRRGSPVRRAAVVAFVLMVVESAIGALLVKKGLVAEDRSEARAFVVALHLCNTFLLLGAQLVTYRLARTGDGLLLTGRRGLAGALFGILALVVALGASGAITALGDTLFPAQSLQAGVAADFASDAHFLVRLRIWHPALAVLTGVLLVYFAQHLRASSKNPSVRRWALWLSAVFVLQLGVGALNLLLLAPVYVQLPHLLFADLTWLCAVELVLALLRNQASPQSAASAAS